MYYIERNPITDAMFLEGSVPEPAPTEPAWVSGSAYGAGVEVSRINIHRVFRSSAAIPAGTTVAPEQDPTRWTDMRPTLRHRPFGPHVRADGMLFYKHQPIQSTTEDISYRTLQRFANEGKTGKRRRSIGHPPSVPPIDAGGKPQALRKPSVGVELAPHTLSRGTQAPRPAYMLKLLPQPQVVFAFGLRITNWAPVRLSV